MAADRTTSAEPSVCGLEPGAALAAAGGILACVGWFFRIYGYSGSGLDLAVGGDIEWWARLGAALGSVALAVLTRGRSLRARVITGAILMAAAAHWAFGVLRLAQAQYYRDMVMPGWYLVTAGFIAVFAGGLWLVLVGTRPMAER